tara:strand:- start:688 stop:987 length:300 start_codon:yes stop_codon:yes gene_type:complete
MSNKKLRVEFSVSWLAGTTGEYEFDDSQEFSEFMEMDEEEKRNFLICAHDEWTHGNTQEIWKEREIELDGEIIPDTIEPADKYTEGYMTWATAISGGAA